MNLQEAIKSASLVLNEERACPTVSFELSGDGLGSSIAQIYGALEGPRALSAARSQRPRHIVENPRLWRFTSVNYEMLCALRSQVDERSKSQLMLTLVRRLGASRTFGKSSNRHFQPSWNGFISELPLVVEFLVRHGASEQLFEALRKAQLTPAHAVLLRHIEDMIAFGYTVFTEFEYVQLDSCMSAMQNRAQEDLQQYEGRTTHLRYPEIGSVSVREFTHEVINATSAIREECRKARYLYLKSALLEGLNLEVNQDKEVVQDYLRQLGFSDTLSQALNAAERLYRAGGDKFSLKSCMGHLRSFMEGLQDEALAELHLKYGGPLPKGWGKGLVYLRQNNVVTAAEEAFAASLYTLISDSGVHALVAGPEYARLARNVVIEYALLFLRKLEALKAE